MTSGTERASDGSGRSPDVSIVIVTWNSDEFIGRCLRAINGATEGVSSQTLVIDNASTDDTRAIAGNADGVELIALGQNRGFAGGVNRALQQLAGRFVMLLNPDCVPDPGSITALVRHLEANEAVAGVAPLLVDERREPQRGFQLRRLPTLRSLLAEILLWNRIFPGNPYSSSHSYRDAGVDGQPVRVEQPAGAAILLRKSVLDATGPFDERFTPAWFEDVDYCQRLRNEGHSLELVPGVVVQHRGSSSLTRMSLREFLTIWYRNLHRYASKWFSGGQAELVRWTIMVGMVLRSAAIAIGLSRLGTTRREAIEAHLAVLRDAWRKWRA